MKVWIRTFGCRANHYDSEMVRDLAARAGHEIVGGPADADVAVFNSCAVTGAAEAELRKDVRRASRLNPQLRSTIMGCVPGASTVAGTRSSLRALPTVERLVDGAELTELAELFGGSVSPDARPARQAAARATLRVQDGCDEHCTFCVTTVARGGHRSRAVAGLIDEARSLAEHHAEIVISGTHIGSYGTDVGLSLGELVERLVGEVDGARFRLSSIEATEVDDRLASLLSHSAGRVAPYLHAPLQSGSDAVLRRMGRHWYSASAYAHAIERIALQVPVFGLGADVIAGFPGETDADHEATLALVERLPFTSLHVFPFSARPGTAATRLGPRVPDATVKRRAAELREAADQKAAAYRAARAGALADVVVCGIGPDGRREGVTEDYLFVSVIAEIGRGERFTARLELQDGRLVAVTP